MDGHSLKEKPKDLSLFPFPGASAEIGGKQKILVFLFKSNTQRHNSKEEKESLCTEEKIAPRYHVKFLNFFTFRKAFNLERGKSKILFNNSHVSLYVIHLIFQGYPFLVFSLIKYESRVIKEFKEPRCLYSLV